MTEDAQDVEVQVADEIPAKGSTEWYETMSKLMRAREHSKLLIARHESKLADIEADIKSLTGDTTELDA